MSPNETPLPGLPPLLPPAARPSPALVSAYVDGVRRPRGNYPAPMPPPKPGQKPRRPADVFIYSLGEEIANSVTHGLGLLLAIVGLVVLVARAAVYGDAWHVVSSAVFGATLVLLYGSSTLYHAIPQPRAKAILRVFDHVFIFFLIAGTYTPFTLVTLHGPVGWTLFSVVWGLAAFGVVFKVFFTGRYEFMSVALYVFMGWCVLFAIKPLMAALAPGGLWLMAGGGLAYSLGVFFYAYEKMRYGHAIWHVFVLLGSALHYFAVLFYVLPRG